MVEHVYMRLYILIQNSLLSYFFFSSFNIERKDQVYAHNDTSASQQAKHGMKVLCIKKKN